MAAVPVGVARREELAGVQVLGAESLDEVPGADQLVVAGGDGEIGPGLAGALPVGRLGIGRAVVALALGADGRVGEAGVLGIDAGVDDADLDALPGLHRPAEALPDAGREAQERRRLVTQRPVDGGGRGGRGGDDRRRGGQWVRHRVGCHGDHAGGGGQVGGLPGGETGGKARERAAVAVDDRSTAGLRRRQHAAHQPVEPAGDVQGADRTGGARHRRGAQLHDVGGARTRYRFRR